MANRNTILNELRDLDSTLENLSPQNLYAVPYGYFEGLPAQIMNRIKAFEAKTVNEELHFLSPLLSNASQETPYSVPANYFQDLTESLLYGVKNDAVQTSDDEIETLSPLLSSLKDKNPYSVPVGYFDSLEPKAEKRQPRVISFTARKLYRLAIAAAVFGIVAITGLFIFNRGNNGNINDPEAWVNKNVIKKMSSDKIDEFVTLVAPNTVQKTTEGSKTTDAAEVKELLKDVPQKEIDEFLNDAVALESNDNIDALMND